MKLLIHEGPLKGETIDFVGADADRDDMLDTGFATLVIEKPPKETQTRIQKKKRRKLKDTETAVIEVETPED